MKMFFSISIMLLFSELLYAEVPNELINFPKTLLCNGFKLGIMGAKDISIGEVNLTIDLTVPNEPVIELNDSNGTLLEKFGNGLRKGEMASSINDCGYYYDSFNGTNLVSYICDSWDPDNLTALDDRRSEMRSALFYNSNNLKRGPHRVCSNKLTCYNLYGCQIEE